MKTHHAALKLLFLFRIQTRNMRRTWTLVGCTRVREARIEILYQKW